MIKAFWKGVVRELSSNARPEKEKEKEKENIRRHPFVTSTSSGLHLTMCLDDGIPMSHWAVEHIQYKN